MNTHDRRRAVILVLESDEDFEKFLKIWSDEDTTPSLSEAAE